MFGFTSKASIHWIVPVIGAALYLPGIFLNFQSILMYITMAYPNHAASVLAGNDLFRSAIASVFPYVDRFNRVLTGSDIIDCQAFRPCFLQKPWTRTWFRSVSWYIFPADARIFRE